MTLPLKGVQPPHYENRDHDIYFYEWEPLVKIMEYLTTTSNDSGKLRFSDGKRNDDGIVILNGMEQKIQFVLAVNGPQEAIRMEHLKKYGRAPGFNDMKWQGTKHKRKLPEQDSECFELNEILEKLRRLIQGAVLGKIKPQYKDMWLGVVFEDLPPSNEKTKPRYSAMCEGVVEEHKDELRNIYLKVFFVGLSGNYIKHYDI